jgi:molybdopterin-guanine dinucleotide biosynthesis protein A
VRAEQTYDAVVLAGGAGRRLGGADKPALRVGGRTLLDVALAACADAASSTVVGPRRQTARDVRWTRERPAGGGPVAALAAGLPYGTAGLVAVLAADLPGITQDAVRALLTATSGGGHDGALYVDADGRDQPLAAVYRRTSLTAALAGLGDPDGAALRRLLAGLDLVRLPDPDGVAADCDTWPALRRARSRARQDGAMPEDSSAPRGRADPTTDPLLAEWLDAVCVQLGVARDAIDLAAVLDLARAAAHGVARPAAPLTTYLAGYAIGRQHADADARALLAELTALADDWPTAGDG